MNNIYLFATVVSITFLLFKFIEMRFVEKENKPLKLLVRDTIVVFFSVVLGNFVLEQIDPVIQKAGENNIVPVFTDNPSF